MQIERIKSKDEPKGGWLGPPPTKGLRALGEVKWEGKKKKRRAKLVAYKLSAKDKKQRKRWEKAMMKADKKGRWDFKW
jgi:hypothetical protein